MSDCTDDRFVNSCNPAFIQINGKLDQLLKTVCIGNGTPPLTTRVAVLEERVRTVNPAAADDGTSDRVSAKSVAFGPVKINGYAASDAGKIILAAGVVFMMYLNYRGLRERDDLADQAKTMAAVMERDRSELKHKVAELSQIITERGVARP